MKKTAVNRQSGFSLASLGAPSKLDAARLQGTLLKQQAEKNSDGVSGDSGSGQFN